MFTHAELIAAVDRLAALEAMPIEGVMFGHFDFESASSEQTIEVFRGSKQIYGSGLLFWIKTLQIDDWQQTDLVPIVQESLCEPITEEEFAYIVSEYSSSLNKPLPKCITELRGYKSGLRMTADWNEVRILAELADSFVAFNWSTSV